MDEIKKSSHVNGPLHLNKWFLDFVNEDGKLMIFYAAFLQWKGLKVPYSSWLLYCPENGKSQKSRFRKIHLPQQKDNVITWSDPKFGVEGTWESKAAPLESRIFDSDDGYLDWKCFQPASKVQLNINGNTLKGCGYAEQLTLTAFPWKIPMEELRWGRFISPEHNIVWIELRKETRQQWLWLNGKKIVHCIIEDDYISIPDEGLILKLGKNVTLESEKKIFNVVEKLIRHLPGFNKIIPIQFLMADEKKWFSTGVLEQKGKKPVSGHAIHELVNFIPDPD